MPIICFHDGFKARWTSLSITINKYIKHLRVERERERELGSFN